MILTEFKIYIFEGSRRGLTPLVDIITVNYKTLYKLKGFSTMLFVLLFSLAQAQSGYRTIDGSQNHPEGFGATNAKIERVGSNDYLDGISEPAAPSRANPRLISNYIFEQQERVDNQLNLSDYVWAFGQFLDHDISLVHNNADEFHPIPVISEESYFEVGDLIVMDRSEGALGTGTDISNPREYTNAITSFIDGSNVYGSDESRANWLRDPNSNIGKLKVSDGNLLPWNTDTGEVNGSSSDPTIPEMDNIPVYTNRSFVAGDVRANENPLLIALHTIFVREHNRLCDELYAANPGWSGEKIYLEARKWVGAYLQGITYFEWLPSQGVHLAEFSGYIPSEDPSIFNVFSAAAFRMGHTLINSSVIRMEDNGQEMISGNVELRDAYFNPTLINISGGIEPYLKGMATNVQQDFDCKMIDDLRNFLFVDTPNGALGLDLAAININRGRERGLADYNSIRYNFGLPKINDFIGITSNTEEAEKLSNIYNGDYNDIDPWVGMLAEEHESGALVGKTVMTILEKQFQQLRVADRFYFENDPSFSAEDIETIKTTTLHDVIMRNTDISLIQEEVFSAMPHSDIPNGPELLPLQLEASTYPNPADNKVHIKFYMEVEEPIEIALYSSNGEMLWTREYETIRGDNFIEVEMGNEFPRGLYNFKLETDLSFKVLRVIKR